MLKSQTRVLKGVVVDSVSLCRQALGLPGGRTRAQIAAIKASFSETELDRVRIALVSQASNQPEAQIAAFVDEFRAFQFKDDVPDIMSLRDGLTLYALMRAFSPRICVETGAFLGSSARAILSDLVRRGDGRLYSVDVDKPGANRYGELIPTEWRERWELRLQKHEPILPALLEELHSVDLFLHDSRHTYRHMHWEYELAWPYLRTGGCLASHDVITTTAFDDFRRDHAEQIASSGVVGNLGFIVKQ